MKILIVMSLGIAASGCTSFGEVTYQDRIQIRQDMARLQSQAVQRQIIRNDNDKHYK